MTLRKLDLFPSSGEGGEEDIYSCQLGPLERANLSQWTTPVRFAELFNHSRPSLVSSD
jgi:hypothetical protein